MSATARRIYRVLLHALPRTVRDRDGELMADAFVACLERERRRRPITGAALGWLAAVLDVVTTAASARRDARRLRQLPAFAQTPIAKGDPMITTLWQDARVGARRMRQAPAFSAAIVLTLALATGATTAIFSIVDAVLLRPLPYRDADRLVLLYMGFQKAPQPIGFSPPDYEALVQRQSGFEKVAAFGNREFELSGVSAPERIHATSVSWSLFDTLGVQPALGRAFTREEDEGRQPVAILSASLWRRAFAADPSIVGRPVVLDRRPYTVVGVMPDRFTFPNRGTRLNGRPAELYVPISFTDVERGAFGSMYNKSVVARLAPGFSVSEADSHVRTTVQTAARERYPADLKGLAEALTASATPLLDETVGRARTPLFVLFAAVVAVLLIACADLAALMLTRAVVRQREMAVRTALGAARSRLIRQALVESSVLAVSGAVLGVIVARWVASALVAAAPDNLPRLENVGLDLRVLGFAALLAVATAVLCGLLPALELTRPAGAEALKEGARSGGQSRRQRRIFGALVTVQFALAVILLAGGGLLLRSFNRLLQVDPGFKAERVLTMSTSLPASAYPRGADVRAFYTTLLDRLQQLPGAVAVAASTDLPLGIRERRAFTIEAESPATRDLPHGVAHEWVAGSYFETLGVALKRGRYLSAADTPASERVVVINEAMARMFWRDEDPVGRRIAWGNPQSHGPWMRIAGVVADIKQGPLNSEVAPQTFQPWAQVADSMLGEQIVGALRSLKLSIRTAHEPMALASAVRTEIRRLDPSLPVTAVRTMTEVVEISAAPQRFNTVLLAAFAALALLLAAIGIAGVLATSVSRRTQELGIRMALGARRGSLLQMVLREGMVLALVGLAIGLPLAIVLTRLMATLLFEISPTDPLTFMIVGLLLLAVALVACYIPARRATAVDPIAALRQE